jgi:hypothetical protein
MTNEQKEIQKLINRFSNPNALIQGIKEWAHDDNCKKC